MQPVVSNEVWSQLDPYAGQLPPRIRRRLLLSILAIGALAIGAVPAWRSGVVKPWIRSDGGYSGTTEQAPPRITFAATIVNDGWTSVDVLGAGRDGPGLRLTEVRGDFPATVAPGDTLTFTVVYQVTDCAAVPIGPWPMPVRVSRLWGESTVYVDLPTITLFPPEGQRYFTGPDPDAKEWQFALADGACHPHPG